MNNKARVSIILCTYNESSRIEKAIKDLKIEIKKWDIISEIIIIDNKSTDGTSEIIKKFTNGNCYMIQNKSNIGKGGSIKKGIKSANYEYIMVYDPDLEYDPSDILRMYNYAIKFNYDFVIGSRRLKRKLSLSEIKNDKNKGISYLVNYLGVYLLTELINLIYNTKLTDAASALKLFKKNFIKKINLRRNGFNLDFELVCKTAMHGGKLGEIEVKYYPRSKNEGKKIRAISDGFASLLSIISNRFEK